MENILISLKKETLLQKLLRLVEESKEELAEIGLKDKIKDDIEYSVNYKAKKRLGQCVEKWKINISSWLLEIANDHDIKNTIIHEILHTFDDTKGHGARWQYYAEYVNSRTDYNITRLAKTNEIMKNNNVDEEYRKELMNYKYEIICKKCGKTFYKRRLNSRTLWNYKNNNMIHNSCGGKDFIVKDIKINKIIVGDE